MPNSPAEQLLINGQVVQPLALAPFEKWVYGDVAREVRRHLTQGYLVKKAYAVDKDHFQKGEEWVGPGDAKTNEKIEKQFSPEDAIGEVLSNLSNAFSKPQISLVPKTVAQDGVISEALKARIAQAKDLLTQWWEKRKIQEMLQKCQKTSAWAGSAGLRVWIPWRFLNKDANNTVTLRSTSDLAEALDYLHVTAPLPEQAMLLVDPNTQEMVAVYMDVETTFTADGNIDQTFKRAELVFLDPERTSDTEADTVFRIVYENESKPALRGTMKLGGLLMFSNMVTEELITEPVMRTQRQVNLLASIITRIGETAAFRERYTINARPQGIKIPYKDGDSLSDGAFVETDEQGSQWQIIPQPRTLGANTTTELVGLPKMDTATGDTKGYETPGVVIAEPVDPKPYLEAVDGGRRRILRMSGQGHLGGISTAEASGIAYEQNRAVFEKDLDRRRISEEGMLREMLTVVLTLMELITGQTGYFTQDLRVAVTQRINAGPRSPDLVRLDLESYDNSTLSLETTMARTGVEDIEAEVALIVKSPRYTLTAISDAVKGMQGTFSPESIKAALLALGIDPNVVNKLMAAPPPPPPTLPHPVPGAKPGAPPVPGA